MGIKPTTGDHVVIPPDNTQSRWGEWDHDHIHKNTGAAYEKGWLVKSHANPLEIPCLRRGEHVVLDDEGGYTPEMEVN